jgi:hypothetical protein
MSVTHDPYLLQTHSQARIDTGLAKPNGVACTSSLMPLPERLTDLHRPASVQQHQPRRRNSEAPDDIGLLIGLAAGATVLLVAFAGFVTWVWRVLL